MRKERNDYFRSLLSKPFNELQKLENKEKLVIYLSGGICSLMKENGGAHKLLAAITKHKIKRETDPFRDHRGGLFTYCNKTIFFKITYQKDTAFIEIGLYSDIHNIKKQRNNYAWFALAAVKNF